MKLFNYLLAICFMFLLSLTDTHAQKTETVKKDLSVELGGTYLNYDFWSIVPDDTALGAYLKLEKIWDKNFGFFASYGFRIYNMSPYEKTAEDGRMLGIYEATNYFHSLALGGNWYIMSSDIANKFTPYIGANIMFTYSYGKETPTYASQSVDKKSYGALNFAFVPNVGLNIPISSALGIRVEAKYKFSLFDIEIEERVKRNWEYYAFSLGLKYSF